MELLVRTPSPYLTESLLGYVLRVSEENGYDTPWHVLQLARVDQGQMQTAGFPVAKLAGVLGKSYAALEHLSYRELTGEKPNFKILGHHLGPGLNTGPFRLNNPAFCPLCVAEHGHIDAFWDLSAAVACPQHGVLALNACPNCKSPINWFRPGLLRCQCGADFSECSPAPVSEGLQSLMNVLFRKLHRLPIVDMDNQVCFPLQQLDKVPFGSLLQIVNRLGQWNNNSHSHKAQDNEHALLGAVESLKDWPSGFHAMLHRLGEKSLQDGVGGFGLRKQFGTFYENMFKGCNSARHAGFLKHEFIEFGKFHWGQALVDGKLCRAQSLKDQHTARFISRSAFAKRYRLWKPTMDRLIQTGVVSTKLIKAGKSTRILVDLEKSNLPVISHGIISVRDAARRAGIPVSVLQWARKFGLYTTKVRAVGSESSWHQDDVDDFIKRGMALAPLSNGQAQGVTIRKAMQLHLPGSTFKLDIISAVFDCRLRVVGSNGENLAGLLIDSRDFAEFVRLKRIVSLSGTYSAFDAAKKAGLDPMVIKSAVAQSLLEVEVINGNERLTGRSVESFCSQYIPLAKLSTELGTSTTTLLKSCLNNDIPVISLQKANTTGKQPILDQRDEGRLRAVWAKRIERRSAEKQQPRGDGEAAQVELLRNYLNGLTARNDLLPRLADKPNKAAIAKEAGFGRDMFYSYPQLSALIDAHDAIERQRDGSIPRDPLVAIKIYLANLRDNNLRLPVRRSGKPNLVVISMACGCHRNIVYTSPTAKKLLDDFVEASKLAA